MTQANLADRANIAVNHYQQIEYGRTSPNIKTAQRLAKALGTTIEDLFPSQEEASPLPK